METIYVKTTGMFVLLIMLAGMSSGVSEGAAGTPAENLAASLPSETLMYAATSGGDSLRPAFEASVIGQLWKDPAFQGFYQEIRSAIQNKIIAESQDPQTGEKIEEVKGFLREVFSRPVLAAAVRHKEAMEMPFYVYLVLDAGPRYESIKQKIETLQGKYIHQEMEDRTFGTHVMRGMKKTGQGSDVDWYFGWVEKKLIVALNDPAGQAVKNMIASSMEGVPPAVRSMPGKPAEHGDAMLFYADSQAIARTVRETVIQEETDKAGAEKKMAKVAGFLEAMGVHQTGHFVTRIGFSGRNLVSDSFLEIPAPHRGVVSALGDIDTAMLDSVDGRAFRVVLSNVNVPLIYDTLMAGLEKVLDPADYAEGQAKIETVEKTAGFRIRGGILAGLAGPLAGYQLPPGAMMEAPMGGGALIVKLNDSTAFEKEFLAFQQYLANLSEGNLQISTQAMDGKEIHVCMVPSLAMMQFMPCWVVADGNLIFASHPAVCQWILQKDSSAERKTFRENPEFQQDLKSLPPSICGLEYIQSRTAFLIGIQQFQQFWPMITMMLQKQGMVLPAVFPDLRHLAEQMAPALAYEWRTEEGIRIHTEGPLMVNGPMTVAAAGIGVSILIPAVVQARQTARQIVCATNLKNIGVAIMVYRNDHQGKNPPNLSILVKEADLSEESLKCPSCEMEADSYIYRGVDLEGQEHAADLILVYEKAENHHSVQNVLFADGHVNKLKEAEFQQAVEKDNQILREIGLPEKGIKVVPSPGGKL